MLHRDAPAHVSLLICSYLVKHQTSIVPHPPYTPDLAPAEFFLFPKLKTTLKGHCFQTIVTLNLIVAPCIIVESLQFISQRMHV